jgi:hypothetical protein
MQRYTIFLITVYPLRVSGGFSAHHQELKNYTQRLVYVKLACCYRSAVAASKHGTYQMLCVQF